MGSWCLLLDVKPSNVLINTLGQVKMCDFGISGYLVDSVAKTIDAGCKPYMAVSMPAGGGGGGERACNLGTQTQADHARKKEMDGHRGKMEMRLRCKK